MKNKLVEKDDSQVVIASSDTLLGIIGRAAQDPHTDPDKMERLFALYERMENRKAEAAFNAALSKLQSELPQITESGKIMHGKQLISQYAKWDEDIHPILRPLLLDNGFSLSFRVDTGNGVKVEAVLAHVLGHSERTSITLPSDTGGAKNAVQAIASSVSYGKRYTAGALLNFATGGQDDDGQAAGGPERISEEQVADLKCMIDEVLGDDTGAFYTWMRSTLKALNVSDLNQRGFDTAVEMLNRKKKGAK